MKYFTKSMRLSNTTGLLGIRNSILQNEKLIEEQPNGDFKFTVVLRKCIFSFLYLYIYARFIFYIKIHL